MESNDSPEIPDRGETSDIPGLPSGDETGKNVHIFEEVLFFKLRTTIQQKTVKTVRTLAVNSVPDFFFFVFFFFFFFWWWW